MIIEQTQGKKLAEFFPILETTNVYQGFLQLDDIGSEHDPHLRIIGGHRETLEGHNIHKVKTCIMNVHTTHTQLRERESAAYPKNVF